MTITPDFSGTTKFIYDGHHVIVEVNSSQIITAKYISGAGIDETLVMMKEGSEYYYHYDGLGSVSDISDSGGNTIESYAYDVYGKASIPSSVGNPYMFTGRRYDKESGLHYYRARYYNADIGRFVQPDPISYFSGINFYAYVKNNPVNLIDPLGLLQRNDDGTLRAEPSGSPVTVTHPSGTQAAVQPMTLHSDDGRSIQAYEYISGHEGMRTDCHGVTFGDSEYWINNDQVNNILQGDNYVQTLNPQVGDILTYRDSSGNVVHSVTVTIVDPSGEVTGVTGLGGIQTDPRETTPEEGWPGASSLKYYSGSTSGNDNK